MKTSLITALIALGALIALSLTSCTTLPDGSISFQPTPEQLSAGTALVNAFKAQPVTPEK